MIDWNKIDVILGIEAMGLPISTLLSSRMKKPLLIVRKRSYGLEEVCINQKTGYSKGELYINDLNEEKKY